MKKIAAIVSALAAFLRAPLSLEQYLNSTGGSATVADYAVHGKGKLARLSLKLEPEAR